MTAQTPPTAAQAEATQLLADLAAAVGDTDRVVALVRDTLNDDDGPIVLALALQDMFAHRMVRAPNGSIRA